MTGGTELLRDITAEDLLKRLSDLENYPHDVLAPYEEYKLDGKRYYFTPGGFLYRKDPGTEVVGATSAVTSPMRSGTTGLTTGSRSFLLEMLSYVPWREDL